MQALFYYIFGCSDVLQAVAVLPLVALGVSLLGSAAGQIGSAAINKERQAKLDELEASNAAFFNKQLYQDELSRSENQAFLRELSDKLKKLVQTSRATAAITGATPEQAIAVQGKAADAYGQTINRLAAVGSRRKDMILNASQANKMQMFGLQDRLDASKMGTWEALSSNAAKLGAAAIPLIKGGTAAEAAANVTDTGKEVQKSIDSAAGH